MTLIQQFIEYMEEDEGIRVQTKKEVCPTCDGKGTTWHGWGYETEPCSFSQDEWNELDYETQDEYMTGGYDRACPQCYGNNVVDVVSEYNSSEVLEQWLEWQDSYHETRAIERMERMMGA